MLWIEDYALIGDCETAALVGRDGSIDWLCLPRFDSDSCFAKLLGSQDNGFWRVAPAKPGEIERRYQPGTLILETTFTADGGRMRVTDFMPPKSDHSRIVRIVEGLEGSVEMQCELAVRFEYGNTVPWVSRLDDDALSMVAGASMLVLRTDVRLKGRGLRTVGNFTVTKGERKSFVLTYGVSYQAAPGAVDPFHLLKQTSRFWRDWSGQCKESGPYSTAVSRSLITLKALTY
ncbi:MAG: glycoside hydrolase family 15 protein, partial [Methylobacteriaceae bacterium]|nr:glycoside hydrolase family 15 protein [Methylobacteriaceae bacterium]